MLGRFNKEDKSKCCGLVRALIHPLLWLFSVPYKRCSVVLSRLKKVNQETARKMAIYFTASEVTHNPTP